MCVVFLYILRNTMPEKQSTQFVIAYTSLKTLFSENQSNQLSLKTHNFSLTIVILLLCKMYYQHSLKRAFILETRPQFSGSLLSQFPLKTLKGQNRQLITIREGLWSKFRKIVQLGCIHTNFLLCLLYLRKYL